MRDARIRLLLNPKLEEHERKAAASAAAHFERFGLKVETITSPDAPVWKDLCRKRIFEAVFREGMLTLHGSEPFGRPSYGVPNDGAILAALTPHKIEWVSDRRVPLEGFNLFMVGSVVSTSSLKPSAADPYRSGGPASPDEAAEAIRLSMIHELGHALLGREPVTNFGSFHGPLPYDDDGHCLAAGCIMRNVADYLSLLRRVASDRMDFCERCGDLLKSRVSYINYLGAA
ncbi:MAG: hypothetical protein AB1529_06530 [Candidatus Micrarchaeota archaeon]